MIHIQIAVVLLLFTVVPEDLKKMRALFPHISQNEKYLLQLQSLCADSRQVPLTTRKAYAAAAEMASAQFKSNPLSKLHAFNNGKTILEACVKADSNNAEIRYIRYTIQCGAPSFLGYNKNKGRDKIFLTQKLPALQSTDKELFAIISTFLLSGH